MGGQKNVFDEACLKATIVALEAELACRGATIRC